VLQPLRGGHGCSELWHAERLTLAVCAMRVLGASTIRNPVSATNRGQFEVACVSSGSVFYINVSSHLV